jgi:hypothetical protein
MSSTDLSASEKRARNSLPYMTRRQLAHFLSENGFPISKSTLDKLCMTSCGEGPPAEGYWSNKALYSPDKALIWAKRRFRTSWRQEA